MFKNVLSVLQGYDRVLKVGNQTAVSGGTSSAISHNGEYVSEVLICETEESLMQAMSVEASASVGYDAGATSANADTSVKKYHELKITSHSVSIVIKAIKKVSTSFVTSFDVSDKFTLTENSSLAELDTFTRVYGDSFIQTLTTGAEYYCIFAYTCTTKEEKDELTTEINAQVKSGALNSSASSTTNFSTLTTSKTTKISQVQYCTGFITPPPLSASTTTEAILGNVEIFGATVPDAPKVLGITAVGYGELLGAMPFYDQLHGGIIAKNIKFFHNLDAQVAILSRNLSAIKAVYKVFDHYSYPYEEAVVYAKAAIDADINKYLALCESYNVNPTRDFSTQPPELITLSSVALGYPVLHVQAHKSKIPFDQLKKKKTDKVFADAPKLLPELLHPEPEAYLASVVMRADMRITEIAIHLRASDKAIARITVKYTGNTSAFENKDGYVLYKHGDDNKKETSVEVFRKILQEGVFISQLTTVLVKKSDFIQGFTIAFTDGTEFVMKPPKGGKNPEKLTYQSVFDEDGCDLSANCRVYGLVGFQTPIKTESASLEPHGTKIVYETIPTFGLEYLYFHPCNWVTN